MIHLSVKKSVELPLEALEEIPSFRLLRAGGEVEIWVREEAELAREGDLPPTGRRGKSPI